MTRSLRRPRKIRQLHLLAPYQILVPVDDLLLFPSVTLVQPPRLPLLLSPLNLVLVKVNCPHVARQCLTPTPLLALAVARPPVMYLHGVMRLVKDLFPLKAKVKDLLLAKAFLVKACVPAKDHLPVRASLVKGRVLAKPRFQAKAHFQAKVFPVKGRVLAKAHLRAKVFLARGRVLVRAHLPARAFLAKANVPFKLFLKVLLQARDLGQLVLVDSHLKVMVLLLDSAGDRSRCHPAIYNRCKDTHNSKCKVSLSNKCKVPLNKCNPNNLYSNHKCSRVNRADFEAAVMNLQ